MASLRIADLFNVEDLVVVITGGGSGLGSHAAKALAINGAKAVYIVGRREEALKRTAAQVPNGNIIPLVGDVSKKQSLLAMAAQVRKEQGYLNVLFANAGITGPMLADLLPKSDNKPSLQELQEAMLAPSMEEFTAPFMMNCTAVFYTAMAFLDLLDEGNKKMKVPQSSQFLVTSSIAGFSRNMAAGFAYSSSKAGATHLVKVLATYFGDYKIRCNAIAPGLYLSEMTAFELGQAKKHEGVRGAFEDAVVLPRTVSPAERSGSEQDFASAILFLMSPAGAYLDGNVLVTDGGRVSLNPSTY